MNHSIPASAEGVSRGPYIYIYTYILCNTHCNTYCNTHYNSHCRVAHIYIYIHIYSATPTATHTATHTAAHNVAWPTDERFIFLSFYFFFPGEFWCQVFFVYFEFSGLPHIEWCADYCVWSSTGHFVKFVNRTRWNTL